MKTIFISLIASIVLSVGGLLCPPIGIIDGSVLSAIGLLLMFVVVEKIPEVIKAGKSVRIQQGHFGVEISDVSNPETSVA